jgi:hypothetical protein
LQLLSYYWRVVHRAAADTFAFTLKQGLIVAAVSGFVGTLVYSRVANHVDVVPIVIGAVGGIVIVVAAWFVGQLAVAPARIDRETREALAESSARLATGRVRDPVLNTRDSVAARTDPRVRHPDYLVTAAGDGRAARGASGSRRRPTHSAYAARRAASASSRRLARDRRHASAWHALHHDDKPSDARSFRGNPAASFTIPQ